MVQFEYSHVYSMQSKYANCYGRQSSDRWGSKRREGLRAEVWLRGGEGFGRKIGDGAPEVGGPEVWRRGSGGRGFGRPGGLRADGASGGSFAAEGSGQQFGGGAPSSSGGEGLRATGL
ncbi:hypothetical protein GUJ93_ZPchr0011g27597 [Zizania palustris]|uniref:Uncharacterized protein n=1 Tax=Zizania palustris TaxID=103762 RepID=A0A8J5WFX6_ZIZPA|nr:hypothetical protein GUJ93_ZPchr0011g27597 [Zizania palustris]